MDSSEPKILRYKRSRFSTALPMDYLYSPSHAWLSREQEGKEDFWRIGLTKFATRMLGEMVDHGFEVAEEATLETGSVVGWVEGFKAISDLYCPARGRFVRSNSMLKKQIQLISQHPYREGWLYEVKGEPDDQCMNVHAYADLLDKAIDRILEKESQEQSNE